MRKQKRHGLLLPAVLVFLATGCGGDFARVTGDVSYDGQPVENGSVTFTPADGKGPSAGAVIEKGRYTATKVPPGAKVIRVEAYPPPSAPGSSDEAKKARGGGKPARLIPANAEGNNAKIEVKVGDQKLDFHLKKPSK